MARHITPSIKICALLSVIFLMSGCETEETSQIGYIEGEYAYIASNASGVLENLAVKRGQEVKRGDLLFQLDPEPEASGVKAVEATISNLQSQVDFYQSQLTRQQNMYNSNATSKMDLEKAQAKSASYVQQLAANKAQLIQTQWSLNQKTVKAPISGLVFDTYYLSGEKIPPYKPVLSILNPANINAIFYLPETKLSTIKIGDKVSINCDGCKKRIQATISYISPDAKYTPPIIYSKDTRDQLVYLIRARLPEDVAKNFHPGQPIDVNTL